MVKITTIKSLQVLFSLRNKMISKLQYQSPFNCINKNQFFKRTNNNSCNKL